MRTAMKQIAQLPRGAKYLLAAFILGAGFIGYQGSSYQHEKAFEKERQIEYYKRRKAWKGA